MFEVKAVLFDLFHTLVDVGAAPGSTGRYTADILGIERERWAEACFSHHHEICRPTRHRDVIESIARGISAEIAEGLIEEAAVERQRRFDYALREIEPGILEVLQGLKRSGYRLGLLSNASTGEVRAWPESPLAELFDAALFSCDCGICKPEPAFYGMALKRLGTTPGEVVFVGDGNSDEHRGASEVGLHTVLTTHFTGHKLDEAGLQRRGAHARWRIDHISELPERIAEIERQGF